MRATIVLAAATFACSCSLANAKEVITFEEPFLVGQILRTQYCNTSTTNRGVEFLTTARRVTNCGGGQTTACDADLTVATASPPHALTNEFFADEYGAGRTIDIRFTTAQSKVSVKVGLAESHSATVLAHLWAFATDVPGGTYLAADSIQLGTGPAEVLFELSVSSSAHDIRSVRIEFAGPAGATYELIDDLTYTDVGPRCAAQDDVTAPVVKIVEPSPQPYTVHGAYFPLKMTAGDAGTGIASVDFTFKDSAGKALKRDSLCGEDRGCSSPSDVDHPWTLEGDAHLPDGDVETLLVRAWDYAGNEGSDRITLHVVPLGKKVNLWAQALEITQGTQQWLPLNERQRRPDSDPPHFSYPEPPEAAPLVAKRTTVVRLFAGVEDTLNGEAVHNARAFLSCFTDPGFTKPCPGPAWILPDHDPPRTYGEIVVRPLDHLEKKRRIATLSWNFVLPSEWTVEGTIAIDATVTVPYGVSECPSCNDGGNHFRISEVTFERMPPLPDLVDMPKTRREVKQSGAPPSVFKPGRKEMRGILDGFLVRMPVVDHATVSGATSGVVRFQDDVDSELGMRCSALLSQVRKSRPNALSAGGKKAVYAVVDSGFPCAGLSDNQGFAYGTTGGSSDVMAEEVGHAVGLCHAGPPPGHAAECDGQCCDPVWPHPHGMTGTFGFDIRNKRVFPKDLEECEPPAVCSDGINNDSDKYTDEECPMKPDPDPAPSLPDWDNAPHDFMSYGPCERWVSPRTWIRMFNAFDAPADVGKSTVVDIATEPKSQVLAGGSVAADGVWTLDAAYELELPTRDYAEEGGSEYTIELLDEEGRILVDREVDVQSGHVDTGDPFLVVRPFPVFVEVLPFPDSTVVMRLRRGNETVAERVRSPHTPVVEVISPHAGGFEGQPDDPRIIWNAEDQDGDELRYLVQFSPGRDADNRRQWRTLAVDWESSELSVDPDDLSGSDDAVVRVLATDGLNTGVGESASFVSEDQPPFCRILSPAETSSTRQGERIVLRGAASDPEEGTLPEERLEWWSDRDGYLGRGSETTLTMLSPGLHEIALRARDRAGHVDEDVVTLNVELRRNHEPIAEAGVDQVSECDGQFSANVRLDGSGSTDPDGDRLHYRWKARDVVLDDRTSPDPIGRFPLGSVPATVTVFDGEWASADTVTVTVEDTVAPVVRLLEPPDHPVLPSAIPFGIFFEAWDTCGIVQETVLLGECAVFDGLTYGDADGLLHDEDLALTEVLLKGVIATCGAEILRTPVITVRVTDAGGNAGEAIRTVAGGLSAVLGGSP